MQRIRRDNAEGEADITLTPGQVNMQEARVGEEAANEKEAVEAEKFLKGEEVAETEVEGGDEAVEIDFDEIAKEYGIPTEGNVVENIKAHLAKAKSADEFKGKLDDVTPLLNELGFLDLDDFKTRMPELLKKQTSAPAEKKETKPAEAQDLAKLLSGFDETSQKFGKILADYFESKLPNYDNRFGDLEAGSKAGFEALARMYYGELKGDLKEQGQKLDVSLPQLKLILKQIPQATLDEAERAGKNPLEVAYRFWQFSKTGQKPSVSPNGKTGTDAAKNLEKPGAVKAADNGATRMPKTEAEWTALVKKDPKRAEQLAERLGTGR